MSIRSASDPDDNDEGEALILPPLDAEESDEPLDDEHHDLPGEPGDERDGLDDSTAGDLDVGDELDEIDERDEPEPEGEVDVGPLDEDIDVEEEDASGGVEPEGIAGDDGDELDDAAEEDDGGAEGTGESPENEVDESALPELDDGEEETDDTDLAAELLAQGEGALPPWSRARLAPLEGAGAAVPCRSLAVAAGRVAAAGEVLLFIEEGARAARRLPIGEGIVAVALSDDALLAATARGQLLATRDGAAEAIALGSWRAGARSPDDARAASPAITLAATPGRFWIRAGGALSCVTAPSPAAPQLVRERGVLAISASLGALTAITAGEDGPLIERFRGDDEGGLEAPLSGLARAVVDRDAGGLLLATSAAGRCLALANGTRIALSRDGGATFTGFDPGPVTAIAFAGDAADAALYALVTPPGSPNAFLVAIPDSGDAAIVAELAADAPAEIAWDASREVVWITGSAGLVALGAPQRH
jgi:hypothetical protein